jgi:hypothetical protein
MIAADALVAGAAAREWFDSCGSPPVDVVTSDQLEPYDLSQPFDAPPYSPSCFGCWQYAETSEQFESQIEKLGRSTNSYADANQG